MLELHAADAAATSSGETASPAAEFRSIFSSEAPASIATRIAVIDGAAAGRSPRCSSASSASHTCCAGSTCARASGSRSSAKNESALLEAHFAVPLAGGVLCALNVRLVASEIAYIVGALRRERDGLRCGVRPAWSRGSPPASSGSHRRRRHAREFEAPFEVHPAETRSRHEVVDEDEHDLESTTRAARRAAQGRDVHASRRVSMNALGGGLPREPAARERLSLDAADVPLQRLVLSVGA